VKWLREAGAAPNGCDYYEYADQITADGDQAAVRRLAVAMALASDERTAGRQGDFAGRWDARQVAEAGYEPGEWEQARLEEARACVAARPGMSCPACGCRSGKTCGQWIRLDSGGYASCDAERAEDVHGRTAAPAGAASQTRAQIRTRIARICTRRWRACLSRSTRRPGRPGVARRHQ
jgi:hypothetical protein